MGIFPCLLLRLLRALTALNTFTGLCHLVWIGVSEGSQVVLADSAGIAGDWLSDNPGSWVGVAWHTHFVYIRLYEEQSSWSPWWTKERKPEWKDRLECLGMPAHWSLSLTPAIMAFSPWRRDGWGAAQATPQPVATSQSPPGEAGLDCGLNSCRLEGKRQRPLVMCLHIRKLKEAFPGIARLENFSNKIVLKSVIFFFLLLLFIWLPFPYFNLQRI